MKQTSQNLYRLDVVLNEMEFNEKKRVELKCVERINWLNEIKARKKLFLILGLGNAKCTGRTVLKPTWVKHLSGAPL